MCVFEINEFVTKHFDILRVIALEGRIDGQNITTKA